MPKTRDYRVVVRQLVETEHLVSLPIPTEQEVKDGTKHFPTPDDAVEALLDVHPEEEKFHLKNARTFLVYDEEACVKAVSK